MSEYEAKRHLTNMALLNELRDTLAELVANKPNDRSEADRCWAIAITDMQKLIAFFKVYVVGE